MRLFKSKTTLILAPLAMIALFVVNFGYRWDKAVSSPIGYDAGMKLHWYEEKRTSLEELGVNSTEELREKLRRQGFATSAAKRGHHIKDGRPKWYVFDIAPEEEVMMTEFQTAWGLCSQAAGVAFLQNSQTVRLLNPGGTCV